MKIENKSLLIGLIILNAAFFTITAVNVYLIAANSNKDDINTTTFAIFDPQSAITHIAEPLLKEAKDDEMAKKIVSNSRLKVEEWVNNDLLKSCPTPCVVFNKQDVLMGDVVDLNAAFKSDLNSR